MIRLCGMRFSNYHNKVRLVLLEKGIEFEEDCSLKPSQDAAFLARSPMGKVPFLEVSGTVLTESRVICEYLEEAYPQRPLLPRDPLERAKVREIVDYIELHLELEARRLYWAAFAGKSVSDETKQQVEKNLDKAVKAFTRLVKFDPYIAGSEFTMADCAAFIHLPIITFATTKIYGRDVFDPIAPLKDYVKRLGEREHFAEVTRGRREASAAMRS